ncbi:MAG: hypothetical protein WCY27_01965 [archaeon]|jgi:hypothetical protein|nr:hypothetical protein [archaeon]MDD2477815.1 hypothetical protein [Candidatus ainarchaeum sp.]MDD3084673.1 hypothetical protein [Candidatus ainarchaeum sp.]MDD4221219.1 hypothetical protein [Candidatus ainarchaeum sp.]MDD4662726.1 hypothetical protein [Candidatus ainarchaeum sp.]
MTLVLRSSKAQVMILDILILLIICILLINIEFQEIYNYKTKIENDTKDIKLLEKEMVVEQLITDCKYLATLNKTTNLCSKNKIEIKNLTQITNNFQKICLLKIDSKEVIKNTQNKIIINIIKRAVVNNNDFKIIEVGFCE